MSSSAVNMCRIVIAVIFTSLVCCVLAEAEASHNKKNLTETSCLHSTEVNASKINLMNCFNSTVARHLDPSIASKPGECQDITDFTETLNAHFNTMKIACNFNNTVANTTDFIKLVDFSLRNESFKKFYADISCVEKVELNISNTCVKNKVGFFEIPTVRRHTTWYRKTTLHYNIGTCATSKVVKNCVEVFLNNCHSDSREYIASLFKYARELADCTNLENYGNGPVPASSLLSTPVIIIISIGSVVVAAAIIIIIVLKFKK